MPTTNKLFDKHIGDPELPPFASKVCSNSTFSFDILAIFPEETLLSLLLGYPAK